jgi:uncharacterized membrane protein
LQGGDASGLGDYIELVNGQLLWLWAMNIALYDFYPQSKEEKTMATMAVFKFHTPDGAAQMLSTLEAEQKQHLITIQDAAIVTWPENKKKPKTKQLVNLTASGALSGTFWGMLFGLIFFVPFFGAAVGALMGAVSGHFADYGIDDNFIKETRNKVTQGTSALLLLASTQAIDKVGAAVKATGLKFEIIQTNLSLDQEKKMKEAFGEEE